MLENPHELPQRFQYSLRSLLLLVTAFALVFAAFRLHPYVGVLALGNVVVVIVALRGIRERHVIYIYYLAALVILLAVLVFLPSAYQQ